MPKHRKKRKHLVLVHDVIFHLNISVTFLTIKTQSMPVYSRRNYVMVHFFLPISWTTVFQWFRMIPVYNFTWLPRMGRSYCLKQLEETGGDYFQCCLSIIFIDYHKPPDNSNFMVLMRRKISHFHDTYAITSLAGLCIFFFPWYLLLACLLQMRNSQLPD